MTTVAPPSPICSICNSRRAPSYFRLTKIANGKEQQLTVVCSIPCLLKWTVSYAQVQGARLAVGVKGAIEQIKGWFGK